VVGWQRIVDGGWEDSELIVEEVDSDKSEECDASYLAKRADLCAIRLARSQC
jgi:hypothetical protein